SRVTLSQTSKLVGRLNRRRKTFRPALAPSTSSQGRRKRIVCGIIAKRRPGGTGKRNLPVLVDDLYLENRNGSARATLFPLPLSEFRLCLTLAQTTQSRSSHETAVSPARNNESAL